jgi:uncharacterized protein YndB with AHSA1/START domain
VNEYGRAMGPDTVRLERLLPGPIDRVWSYLTDSRLRATWLAAGDFDLRIGGRIELSFDNDSLSPGAGPPEKYKDPTCSFYGQITRCEPPRVLAFTWGSTKEPSEVTFELEPRDDQVRLVVTHRRLHDHREKVSVASGWDAHVGILIDRLNGVAPQPFWPTHTRLEREYEARLEKP